MPEFVLKKVYTYTGYLINKLRLSIPSYKEKFKQRYNNAQA